MSAITQPDTTHGDSPTTSSSPARDIALVAAFAALISASAYVGAIPVGSAGVPITLQTLTVMLAGCILGPVRGFSAVSLYLALGCTSSSEPRRRIVSAASPCSSSRATACASTSLRW